MPQPPQVARAAAELHALWAEAQARLLAQLEAAVTEPRQVRRAARLRELVKMTSAMVGHLEDGTRLWVTSRVPPIYATGAAAAAEALGTSFQWTQPAIDAVHALAQRTWETIGPNLQGIRSDSLRAIRGLTRDSARQTLLEGSTARQSAMTFAERAAEQGIASVTYSNGSVFPISAYAETLSRTVSAQAYASGTITQSREFGTEYMLCLEADDDCGLDGHDDDEKPNGKAYPIDTAEEFPVSHPNCSRSWSPLPQLDSQDAADGYNGGEE